MMSGRISHAGVINGAKDGVRNLHQLGFRLVVVTAREKEEMEESRRWLTEHFGGIVSMLGTTSSRTHESNRVDR